MQRLRQRLNSEDGFTLIELLVVILIIGILAAIAIPAFLSQTSKANDSAAKTQVGTLQTTMETYASEHNGSYTGGTLAELQKIEPTLKDTTTATAGAVTVESTGEGFEVSSTAKGSGDVYKLKNKEGEIGRSCTTGGTGNNGGGCKAGSW
ncbi:MAG TPA: prepilin-type N-terminal cleavage/methylation domain-containing protein [Solirubrobacteraceae bacterium]|nr:prepilin-type N-terminal cleavage/methylation domain-containing protein [Solirubrobacteraceae bacterium]